MRRGLSVVAGVVACWLAPGLAGAQDAATVDQVRQLDDSATYAFRHGDYAAAADALMAAQLLLPHPRRLYSIAVCYERLGDPARALRAYERYLADPGAFGESRDRAASRLDELREEIDRNRQEEAERREREEERQRQIEARRRELEAAARASAESRQRQRIGPTAFWATLGATLASGVALSVVGGFAYSRYRSYEELTVQHSDDPITLAQREEALDLREQAWSLALVTDVMIGVTSALALATTLLAIFTRWTGAPETARGLHVGPSAASPVGAALSF